MHRHLLAVLATAVLSLASAITPAQGIPDPGNGSAQISGTRIDTSPGIQERMSDIAARQAASGPKQPHPGQELNYPDRSRLPQNPDAPAASRFPDSHLSAPSQSLNIHTTGTAFNGPTLTDTGAFPPDSMGTVGPTQYIAFVNGRIRSYTKAGAADGVINADPDVFFASVMTPVTGSVLINFTSDPQIRYDRFTGRWFMSIIDVPCTNATCSTLAPNRWLLAVSDAASNGTITGATVWKLFQFQTDAANFCDYPSLGIDVNALYTGCNMFTGAGAFAGTNGYVIQKTSALGAGPLVVTSFPNLVAGAGAGPYTPRGVDNFDSTATEGYFVGVDNSLFSTIVFRRITNPGSLTPTISGNISVVVATTTIPNTVEHAGNTGGTNGKLDALDDRLYQAMIRNGHLWTAHNFRVSAVGVANTAAEARNAVRWYEFQNLTTTPSVVQSGTVYDSAATRAAAFQYWIPSIAATGQGHAVVGFTLAGTPSGATPAYTGRLSGDTAGTMSGPPTTGAVSFGTTTANYNPPSDPGGSGGRRWGDYSFTVVDPLDDMSIWTIQEYNQASNSYAVRIARLLAPPPATPTCTGSPIPFTGPTGDVVINATSSGGSGFYDPGANLPAPARPFNHLTATVTNAVVNSATYNTPTKVTLNITATTAGLQNVTITNPDGQAVTATGCINVSAAGPATAVSFTTQPATAANIVAGATIPIVAHVVDSGGNPVSGQSITLAIGTNPGTSTLSVTTNPVVTNASGDATFANVSLNKIGTGYTLTATDTTTPAATAATSHTFNIIAGSPTSISFTTQPASASNIVAGANIPLTVHVQDTNANPVSGDNITLAFNNNPGSSTLSVTTNPVATNASGNAVFAGVSLNKIGASYSLKATDSSGVPLSVTGNSFNIVAGAPTSISFTTQPAAAGNIAAGANIPLTVHVQDTNANPVSGDNITLAFNSNPGGSTLSVTTNPVATNASGDAAFAGVSLNKVGTSYSLKASDSSGVPLSVTGNSFNIIAGAAAAVSFTTQPATASNIVSGATIPIVAHVVDGSGNPVSGQSITLAIGTNPGTSTLSVTTNPLVSNASGDVTFANVSLNKIGTGYTLTATDTTTPAATVATSHTFNVIAGTATSVSFTTQPATASDIVAGATIPIVAHVVDASSNPVSGESITLAIGTNPGTSTLSVTTNPLVSNASGDVTFANVSLNKIGTGYTLTATDTTTLAATAATSHAFNIIAGSPTSISFTTQPASASNIVAGANIPLTVHVQDTNANPVSGDNITLAFNSNPGSSTLSVTTNPVATNASGDAVFAGVSLNKIGTSYSLKATDSSGVPLNVTGNSFNIVAGAPNSISFTTQPAGASNVVAGANIPLTVHVQDASANPVSGDSITLAFNNNPGSSTLSVTTNPVATNASGDAVFAGVSLNKIGASYSLKATDSSGVPLVATGNSFNIIAGAAAAVSFTTQPAAASNIAAGATIPIVTHVVDGSGNPVSGQSITLAIGTNPGTSTLSVTTNPIVSNASGDATFASVSLNKVGAGYTLTATDTTTPAATAATSNSFNIIAGAPSSISFTTQPAAASNITAGATIPLTVHVQDASANPVSGDSVTLAFNSNPGSSTLSVTTNPVATNASGDATFAGVSLNKIGASYSLKATDSSGVPLSVTGNSFNIIAGAATSISFTTEPSDAAAGVAIAPAIVVNVQDALGNAVAGESVTLAIDNNAGGTGVLSGGGAHVTNALGNSTFNAVSIDKVGVGYTLSANDGALAQDSAAFTISPGAATQLVFSTQPANLLAGTSTGASVSVKDAFGNVESADVTTQITLSVNACGTTVLGVATVNAGVAQFPNLRFYTVTDPSTLQLHALSSSALNANSNTFVVQANPGNIFWNGFETCVP